MYQLLPPGTGDTDLTVLEESGDRTPPSDRPWIMANMVMSLDGAYAMDGVSGGLGSAGDKAVFHHLRIAADAILVAAGTARQERYRRPHMSDEAVRRRRERSQQDHPRLVLVSRSLSLPPTLPLFEGEGPTPLVVHPGSVDTGKAPEGVELRSAGEEHIDFPALLKSLYDDGVRYLLCEGGPSLLGQLHTAGLIDEMFLTLSPSMVGGPNVGLLGASRQLQRPMRLHRLLEQDSALFLTYRPSDR